MISLLISLTIVLNPQTKIKALKLKANEKVLEAGAFIRKKDFILLKNHVESGKCKKALEGCVSSCSDQIELIIEDCKQTPAPVIDESLIQAYEHELEKANMSTRKAKSKASFYFYTSLGIALMGLSSSLWIYTTMK